MEDARQQIDDGVWVLDRKRDLSPLVDRMNKILTSSRQVRLAETDPAGMPGSRLTICIETMHPTEKVTLAPNIGGVMSVRIPVGLWIFVPTRALVVDDKQYPSKIEILGDVITIANPCITDWKMRVKYREYAISA